MSSPSPEPPPSTPEHVYQPAESLSDHNTNTTSSTIPAGGRQSPLPPSPQQVQQQVVDQQPQQVIHSCQCLEQREKTAVTMLNNSDINCCGECLSGSQQHHNVMNLIAHMPPSVGGGGVTPGHIHSNSQVHVHVHASPKSHHNHNPPITTSNPPHALSKHSDHITPTNPVVACTCHHHHHHHSHTLHNEDTGGGGVVIREPRGDMNIMHHHDGSQLVGRKLDTDDSIEVSPLPPALPPRPPPRPRGYGDGGMMGVGGGGSTGIGRLRSLDASNNGRGIRKYVFWCCVCGGLSAVLGLLFMIVYFIVRTYTSTLAYFETIPTIIPAVMLILTGICVISLARRKNRYSYLIKVCGLCCLVCAVTCVLVTITTTVIHMSRLQTLRECVYTSKTRTCTCYSVLLEAHASTDEGMRFVFDSTPDCEVIHGVLYSCLRAMFGLSVSGILICIFSCMLVYQLLSHERKKMYWEQLELRCRSFYQQHAAVPAGGALGVPVGSMRNPPMPPPTTYCSCCDECVYPTVVPPLTVQPQVYPWEPHPSAERFWTPGRVGNFYSPNPGEEITGSTEGRDRANSGWSWRRLAWNRSNTNQSNNIDNNRDNSVSLYHTTGATATNHHAASTSASDSQYGFTVAPANHRPPHSTTGSYSILHDQQQQPRGAQPVPPPAPPPGGVYVWGPPPPYSDPNSPARRGGAGMVHHHHGAGYHHMLPSGLMVGGGSTGHHHPHTAVPQHQHHQQSYPHQSHLHIAQQPHDSHCQLTDDQQQSHHPHHHHHHHQQQQQQQQRRTSRSINNKDNYENAVDHDTVTANENSESTTTDTSNYSADGLARHSLQSRRTRKRTAGTDTGGVHVGGHQQQQSASIKSLTQHHRASVKTIFKQQPPQSQLDSDQQKQLQQPTSADMPEYHEPDEVKSHTDSNTSSSSNSSNASSGGVDQCRYLPRLQGVENAAFQKQESSSNNPQQGTIANMSTSVNVNSQQEPTESEVYFADVSSCCNISVRNDSVLYDEALLETQKPRLTSLQKAVTETTNNQLLQTFQENLCNNTVAEDEEYLAHRLGQRQLSTRSRLPFPLPLDGDSSANLGILGDISTEPCLQLPKDISQNSLCSSNSIQTPMTESTDCDTVTLSPSTPTNNDFVRRNINDFLAPDAQYEVIQESETQGSNLTNTISELSSSFNQGNYFHTKKIISGDYNQQKMSPPKTLNFNQTPSRRIGTNISSLIHNLSGSSSGLLYGDDHSGGDEDDLHDDKKKNKEAQSQNSDCTMDSGWHSGSDKAERKDTVNSIN